MVVAGKAHPQDVEGKQLLQYVVKFFKSKDVQQRVVFLEDYDLSLAQHMVHGIDVWINTPRRKREAWGTSGMKVLVNGGLNLSEPDGWWAEAYSPDVGWTFGDVNVDESFTEHSLDAFESQKLYDILEQEVIPEFYNRDERGIPRDWVARIRNSMAKLAPYYSSNRMLREYVEQCYLPSAEAYQRRQSEGAGLVVEVLEWQKAIADNWEDLHFGNIQTCALENAWRFEVQVYLGDIQPHWVNVELFAADVSDQTVIKVLMERRGEIPGAINGFVYAAVVPSSRPVDHYVPRIVPIHPDVLIPLEESHIFWQR